MTSERAEHVATGWLNHVRQQRGQLHADFSSIPGEGCQADANWWRTCAATVIKRRNAGRLTSRLPALRRKIELDPQTPRYLQKQCAGQAYMLAAGLKRGRRRDS